MVWTGCGSGDFCFGLGPVIELSPTLSLRTEGVVRPYLALNGFVSTMLPGNVRLLAGVGLSFGVAFEFSSAQPTETLEQLPPEAAPTTPQNPAPAP